MGIVYGLLSLVITAAIVTMAINQFRQSQRTSLLWVIMIAARRGLPLPQMIRAFARDCRNVTGRRSLKTAELLENGVALSAALAQSQNELADEAMLAVEYGMTTDCLAASLERAVTHETRRGHQIQRALEKLFYLFVLTVFAVVVALFVGSVITRVYVVMFDDFGLQPPATSATVFWFYGGAAQWWKLGVPLLMLAALVIFASLAYYAGILPRDLPIVGRLTVRSDTASVLRLLALSVEQNRPLPETIKFLSLNCAHALLRKRLSRAAVAIDRGSPWSESLQTAGVIGIADAALLRAAERVGNLSWALDELGDGVERRIGYRLTATLNVLVPVVVLAVGTVVLATAAAAFLPLIALIQGMAQ